MSSVANSGTFHVECDISSADDVDDPLCCDIPSFNTLVHRAINTEHLIHIGTSQRGS